MLTTTKITAVFLAAALVAQPAFAWPLHKPHTQVENYGWYQVIHSKGMVVTTYQPNYSTQPIINPIAAAPAYPSSVIPIAASAPAPAPQPVMYCGGYTSGTIINGIRQNCPQAN